LWLSVTSGNYSQQRAEMAAKRAVYDEPMKRYAPKIGGRPRAAAYPRDSRNLAGAKISHFLKSVVLDVWSAERASATGETGEFCNTVVPVFPRWKRFLDVTLILATLPAWLPVMVALMVWVKIASPGPIFYRQQRVGHGGRHFMIFKVRTMHVNAETQSHEVYVAHLLEANRPMQKLDAKGDARLIRGGRFLRAAGLDELPQIFNVLRGEMTLVGPRPCLPCEFQRYQPWQQQRVSARPGLTGLWQVNGKNKTTFSEMIAMDLFYAKNLSLWFDLKILIKTIPALIAQSKDNRSLSKDRAPAVAPPESTMSPSLERRAKS
jgi:exopolysaccharide production protein ExoY